MHGWQQLLVQAVAAVLSGASDTPAEKVLRKTLRRGHSSLSNGDRKAVARKFYGTISLRKRLAHMLDSVLVTAEPHSTEYLIALITLYTVHEEPKLFLNTSAPRDSAWLEYASIHLPSPLVTAISSPTLLLSILWPTDHQEYIATFHSLPDWLVSLIVTCNAFPTPVSQLAFAQTLNTPSTPHFRTRLAKISRDSLSNTLRTPFDGQQHRPIETEPCKLSKHAGLRVVGGEKPEVLGNKCHQEGLFDVQDEGSQLISLVAVGDKVDAGISGTARPALKVVDLCCGRGGKALHLLDLLETRTGGGGGQQKSCLVCHDVDSGTLKQAKTRMEKAQIDNVRTSAVDVRFVCSELDVNLVNGGRGGDMMTFPHTTDDHGNSLNIPAVKNALGGDGLADIVLVDAPCSSLGTLRRGPNVRWEMNPKSLDVFPPLQKSILSQAVNLVKPGGILVYATCTFNNAECVDITKWFNETFSDSFAQSPLIQVLDRDVLDRLFLDQEIDLQTVSSVQLSPSLHDTDAFYISRWIRKESI